MNKTMLLKEVHKDIERYLKEDCYCPNEIYDTSGFFYQIFKADDECFVLGTAKGSHNNYWAYGYDGLYAICKDQILEFTIQKGKVVDALRMDATENNIKLFKEIIKTGKVPEGAKLDKFENNHTDRDLKELLSLCNCVMVD